MRSRQPSGERCFRRNLEEGRATQLFQHLSESQLLFPPLLTADGPVAPTPPTRLAPADARPLLVQALIRTAQRALNQAVARQFVRTRSERAKAQVAERRGDSAHCEMWLAREELDSSFARAPELE